MRRLIPFLLLATGLAWPAGAQVNEETVRKFRSFLGSWTYSTLVAKRALDNDAQLPPRCNRRRVMARRLVAIPVKPEFIDRLENDLDGFNADLPRLKEFILRGGGPAASACHFACTVVRRAERRVTTLAAVEEIRPEAVRYLNRLSDLLFVIARVLARAENGQDVLWNRAR